MRATFWGTRGSIAAPGADTARYGGNTSCVEVRGEDGTRLILDAGTGIRRLGQRLNGSARRVDLLLTHLHMDHIQGLGFFDPFHDPDVEAHLWGPPSVTLSLKSRLLRYLSPPLFPVRLRDLQCRLILHEVPSGDFDIGEFEISPSLVCHPGPTVGYRISSRGRSIAYIPDHEPALGRGCLSSGVEWTSGHDVAAGVDLLIHDAQYTPAEYEKKIGWGHCTLDHALEFARLMGVKHLAAFHHDPSHGDAELDDLMRRASKKANGFRLTPAMEGRSIDV